MKKYLSNILKVGVTVAGIWYVLTNVDLEQISGELAQVNWLWLVVGALLIAVGLVVRAYRWLILLRGVGAHVRLRRLISLYFVGNFFNAFLPSGFGGDFVRAMEMTQDVRRSVAAGTVLMDRLSGLLMLFVLALLALPFRSAQFPDLLAWQITAVAIVGLIGGLVLLDGNLVVWVSDRLPEKLAQWYKKSPIHKLIQAVHHTGWRAIIGAMLVSTLYNLVLFGIWSIVSTALGYSISYFYFFLVVPVMAMALLIPSIGGLGVRETLAPVLFAGAGLALHQAVTLSLTVFILMRITSLLGAPVYLVSLWQGQTLRQSAGLDSVSSETPQ